MARSAHRVAPLARLARLFSVGEPHAFRWRMPVSAPTASREGPIFMDSYVALTQGNARILQFTIMAKDFPGTETPMAHAAPFYEISGTQVQPQLRR